MKNDFIETILRLNLPSRLWAWFFAPRHKPVSPVSSSSDRTVKSDAGNVSLALGSFTLPMALAPGAAKADHDDAPEAEETTDLKDSVNLSCVASHFEVGPAFVDEGDSLNEPATAKHGSSTDYPLSATLPEALEAAIQRTAREPERTVRLCFARLGIDGKTQTLEAVGERFGITRERVRQIVARTLRDLKQEPVGEAFRTYVRSVLDERDCITISELLVSSTWFGAVDETGLKVLLHAFVPGCYWDGLVSFSPHESVDGAIQKARDRIGLIAVSERAYASIETIATTVAIEAGLPGFATSLANILRKRLDGQSFTTSAYVCDFVERSVRPVTLAEVRDAARARGGKPLSLGQVRNALAAHSGIYPLGDSTFGTFQQVFGETDKADLDRIAALAIQLVEAESDRQHTADELFAQIRSRLGDATSSLKGPHELAVLLRHQTSLRYLKRMVFSTDAHAERLELLPLAQRILRDADGPLRVADLVERMREYRDFRPTSMQAVLSQLTEVRAGFWDLPDRRVPARAEHPALTGAEALARAILVEDAFAAIRPGESLGIFELRGRLAERGSREAENADVRDLRESLLEDDRFEVSANTVRLARVSINERAAS